MAGYSIFCHTLCEVKSGQNLELWNWFIAKFDQMCCTTSLYSADNCLEKKWAHSSLCTQLEAAASSSSRRWPAGNLLSTLAVCDSYSLLYLYNDFFFYQWHIEICKRNWIFFYMSFPPYTLGAVQPGPIQIGNFERMINFVVNWWRMIWVETINNQ